MGLISRVSSRTYRFNDKKMDPLPPIDHYSFYINRPDPSNPNEILNNQMIENYRDLGVIENLENSLSHGTRKNNISNKYELSLKHEQKLFYLDYEAAQILQADFEKNLKIRKEKRKKKRKKREEKV